MVLSKKEPHMKKPAKLGLNLQFLMENLVSKDGLVRQKARRMLVLMGKPAVAPLIKVLQESKADQARWEAAKALGAIGEIRATPALVKALEDSDPGVAWLAAEALRRFKKLAWPVLLRALMKKGADSFLLRQGAHHVLRNRKEEGYDDLLTALSSALAPGAVPESTTVAADNMLKRMKARQKTPRLARAINR
jgi:HEAT repeat protein